MVRVSLVHPPYESCCAGVRSVIDIMAGKLYGEVVCSAWPIEGGILRSRRATIPEVDPLTLKW